MLQLNLLGTASIDAAGVPVAGRAAQGRRLALLALLACARNRCLTRDKLIALLWPDSPTERARRQLSDDVYIVRSALGDDVLRSVGDELSLDRAAITSDVETFERLLDEGLAEAAVELVTGPLLDGFHLADGGEFEHWLDAERARLGNRYAAALQALAEASDAGGRFADAAAWWRRLAAHDPYDGRVALRLMRALEAAGDRAGALRHARVYATLLRDEFDAEPDPEVTALAERLRLEPAARASEPPPARSPAGAAAAAPASRPLQAVAAATQPDAHGPVTRYDPEHPAAGEAGMVTPGEAAARLPESARAGHAPPIVRAHGRQRYAAGIVLLLAVASAGVFIASARDEATDSAATTRAAAPSVGVLPFVNMSGDAENTYFSDGLTEQIITALSHLEGLQVAARTSSFALREERLDARAIGETLGVATVLEGSVRTDGRRLRITTQLIDAATGYHIWSDVFDREIEDVFAVQDEIADAIADALELRLGRTAVAAGTRPTIDLEAYDLYLRGLFLRNSLTADALRQAIDSFDRAIARQPDFALAYAAKTSVLGPLVLYGHIPRESGLREYRALTARALELDPALGEAHAALGILKLFFDWEWEAAERALRRAVELNPNDAHAHHHLANYMRIMGRVEDAVAARARAAELDPLNARTASLLAMDYNAKGDFERAIAEYERARRLEPAHLLTLGGGPWLPNSVADVYLRQGRLQEAVDELVRIATLRGATVAELDALRDRFAAGGMPGFWRAWLEMDLRQSDGAPDPVRIANLLVLSGDTATALDWLDRAYAERTPGLVYMNVGGSFRELSAHPRVARIREAMRFP